MNFGVIVVGDEVLSGKRADKHMPRLIELLSARGLALSWARYVGDEPARLTADLRDAFAGGDAVFCCGGIGATPDDHTRRCAAEALGRPLVLHAQARDLIMERVRQMAREQGTPLDEDHPDTRRRLEMGVFPEGAQIIPNPFNKIPGFSVAEVHFVPGFPVMAHPMIEWLLDTRYKHLHRQGAWQERSVIVRGSMEATLTPLMESLETRFPGVKVFSLPSVDHPQWGRHIELGVKGAPSLLDEAYPALLAGLADYPVTLGPELVR
ncbi:MAG TPA: molybdopterin-binding protein [Albitalea sp.]|nr:molybdopterin-binding protein [Albitalea sp.]